MKFTKKEKTNLEKEIDNLLYDLASTQPYSKEYTAMAANLEMLYKAKSLEKKNILSMDTLAIVAGNLLGILLILKFEKVDIITSKALSLLLKGRA
jgi:hypothetical protein